MNSARFLPRLNDLKRQHLFSSHPFNWLIIGKLPRKLNAIDTPRLDAIVHLSDPFKKIKASSFGFSFLPSCGVPPWRVCFVVCCDVIAPVLIEMYFADQVLSNLACIIVHLLP